MREFQFTIVFLMALMSLSLLVLMPKQVANHPIANRSRLLFAAAFILIGLQFLIQYIGDYRSHDITIAVMINFAFFIPCAAMLNASMLNLQRQGRLTMFEKWIFLPLWVLVISLVLLAYIYNNHPTDGSWSRLLWAEVISSTIFTSLLIYFSILQYKELRRIQEVLDDYYDTKNDNLISWMTFSGVLFVLMGLLVPFLLFCPTWFLMIYGLIDFTGLFFLWFCFVRYIISGEAKSISEVEKSEVEMEEKMKMATKNKPILSEDNKKRIQSAVDRWIANEGYLNKGITSPEAAKEMQLPRYQFTAWVKDAGYNSFSNWITSLRVNHAKELLLKHTDWSNEAIADQCGISRSHFQKVFHELTGMTPAQFIASAK